MGQSYARRPTQSGHDHAHESEAEHAAHDADHLHATPSLEQGTGRGREVDHTTGAEIDAFIQQDEFFNYYIRSSFDGQGNGADGHVNILSHEQYQARWVQYAMARINPNTSARFTEAEALAYGTNAFVDGTQIFIHQGRGEPATAIHESMHLFTDGSYLREMGFNINEGTTEFFTRLLCSRIGVRRGRGFYADQFRVMEEVVEALPQGHNVLASAYFDGNISRLREAMNEGEGNEQRYEQWKAAMQAGNFRSARALF
ncbi:MAG: hypothetical protein VX899_25570 [Myxococcota bacterium]|nr:hypothetical protein [Myxococcota bacterium]